MHTRELGLMDFAAAYSLQERLAGDVYRGESPETLLLLEHPPVYTIGSGGDVGNVLDSAVEVRRINRGGDVTYHGPGQLVGYPIMDLSQRGRDLQRYLRFLEQVLIDTIADFKVAAFPVAGKTGVWTGRGKIASIGIGVRRWVTMHGFAMNVVNDLIPFSMINPCGMANCPVTSLGAETGAQITMEEVRSHLSARFQELMDIWLPLSTC
ncbi:lipoyl(octanoyl) transferase LipB [Geotalea toluenoxydans]|uniref:lipoyl(octanoyl) transferase LipB n=1 Tax=Geotalea toluenoxydans TaxID=421624 RepID=UPI001FB34612|nr:lipoyl(octanoyl) transferase LipB [Geotalea toluenoxydans]